MNEPFDPSKVFIKLTEEEIDQAFAYVAFQTFLFKLGLNVYGI